MNRTEVKTIDDLPELPFEKVLSYLSLEEVIKSRAVSRKWYHQINCFRVKSLFYSDCPSDFIIGKRRLVSGAFAQNFISPRRFATFFDTFGPTILSNLKRLRLYELDSKEANEVGLVRTLNSFGRLEELNIIRFEQSFAPISSERLELNLPMLTSIRLESVDVLRNLILDAPRLRKVHLVDCGNLLLGIVHGESVEHLHSDSLKYIEVQNLKNLQCLLYLEYYFWTRKVEGSPELWQTLLTGLDQLKEIHLSDNNARDAQELFEQKQRYDRADLKIYFGGLLLNSPDDPTIRSLSSNQHERFRCLAENSSRLADEIPPVDFLDYSAIERVDPRVAIDIVSRCTRLFEIVVNEPVQDIEHFLDFLKNSSHNTVRLVFSGDQPQSLFDRLPEHCAVQSLTFFRPPSDFEFLLRLEHLTSFDVSWSIEPELIRKLFNGLPYLSKLDFFYRKGGTSMSVSIDSEWSHPKSFRVSVYTQEMNAPDLESAIQMLFETAEKMCSVPILD